MKDEILSPTPRDLSPVQVVENLNSLAEKRARRRVHTGNAGRKLPPTPETVLFLVQRGRCFHCRGFLELMRTFHHAATSREHVIPKALRENIRGAGDAIVLAHIFCNNARGDQPPTFEELSLAEDIWGHAAALWDEMETRERNPFDDMIAAGVTYQRKTDEAA